MARTRASDGARERIVSFELEKDLHTRVAELCEVGDAHVERGEHDLAIAKYQEALDLLPRPVTRWNAATWILTALGDTHFGKKEYREALAALRDATRCPRGLGNPFLHLRLGQAQLELGNEAGARHELARAYLGAAEEIFAGEDPKYVALARAAARELGEAQALVEARERAEADADEG